MKELLQYPFDGAMIQRKKAALKKELVNSEIKFINKKIAILGGSTTNEVKDMLELWLLSYGIKPKFYQSEYNQYWQDAVFGNAELDEFKPDIVYIFTTHRNIINKPTVRDSRSTVDELLQDEYNRYQKMWDTLFDKYKCMVIQNNFELPVYRLQGNRDASAFNGFTNFITRLNQKFYEYSDKQKRFYINDINFLSADYGLKKWHDIAAWSMYKYALDIKAIPYLAYSVSNIIKAIYGKNKKALVLDLDNTLWGGIVGDDGVEGLQIGKETPLAETYTDFQRYIKEHKDLGILLNIASKNEKENALAGLAHPEGVLKENDFIIIKADWNPKDANIAAIASELNILPDSLVFLDDNPAEREIASKQIIGMAVPPMNDVTSYITTVDRAGYFETVGISEDDLERNAMYSANMARSSVQASFANYDEYLATLEMTADIMPFDSVYTQRISQLTNKSNQFNVTTKRYSEADIEAVRQSPNHIGLYGKLIDKFGDNGIVSILIAEKKGECFELDLFLMSCRVLKRGMENAMIDRLVDLAKECNVDTIRGYYYKTPKNNMVNGLFGTFGFKLIQTNGDDTIWELKVKDYKKGNKFIKVRT